MSFVPEAYSKDGVVDGAAFRAGYDDLAAFKAQHEERMASVPESAEGYDFAMPDELDFGDLNLPEGFTVESLAEDEAMKPLLNQFATMMHEAGLPSDFAKATMGMLAQYEATKYSQMYTGLQQEFAKISNADQRLGTVKTVLEKRLGNDLAASLAPNTAAQLQALEKILSPGGPLTTPPEPGGQDDESLTPYERLKRARGG